MARVFISYRRAESQDLVYRLRDHLLPRCDEVFVDVHSISPGENFPEVLESAVKSSDVVLAVVGTTWLPGSTPGAGLLEPTDYVRVELETAIQHDVVIIPLLVHGASIPTVESLPESLSSLPGLQALEIGPAREFVDTVDRIIARINEVADVHIRRRVEQHDQRTAGLGDLAVKMVTEDGALLTSYDHRSFQVLPEYRSTVAAWDSAEEYAVVLGVANISRQQIVLATEILSLDAREFDTNDPEIFEKLSRFQDRPRGS